MKEQGDLEQIESQLASFVDLFAQYPGLERVMLNPAVPVPRKRATMVQLTQRAETTPIVTKLLVLLAERDRLILLPDVLAAYRERLLDQRHVIRAEVTSATPLG